MWMLTCVYTYGVHACMGVTAHTCVVTAVCVSMYLSICLPVSMNMYMYFYLTKMYA